MLLYLYDFITVSGASLMKKIHEWFVVLIDLKQSK